MRIQRAARVRALPRARPPGARRHRGRCPRPHPGHGAPRRAAPAARVLRQPPGRGLPGGLDEGSRPPVPSPVADGRGDSGEPGRRFGGRSRGLPGRPHGSRRGALAGAASRGVAGGPARRFRRTPHARAAQVPSHSGAARSHPVRAPGTGARAVGPDAGEVRRVISLAPLASAAGLPPGTPRRPAQGRSSGRARPLPPPRRSPRPRAQAVHQVLGRRLARSPARLHPELRQAAWTQTAARARREQPMGHAVGQRRRRHHHAPDRQEVGCARRFGRAVPGGLVRFSGGTSPSQAGAPDGFPWQGASQPRRRPPGQRRRAQAAPQHRRRPLQEVSPDHNARSAPRPVSRMALRRRARMDPGRP